jgi:uncharacterized repeat protein (TIGR01451 family)
MPNWSKEGFQRILDAANRGRIKQQEKLKKLEKITHIENLDFEEISPLTLNKTQRNLTNSETNFTDNTSGSVGNEIEFKLTATNTTGSLMNDLALTDILPSSFEFISGSCNPSCSIINNSPKTGETRINWNLNSINPSSSL